MENKKIGQRFKAARIAANMTQAELAHVANLSPKYVSNIECGSKLPKFETFILLANILKTDANSLLVDVLDVSPQILTSMLSDKLPLLPSAEQKRLLRLFNTMIEDALQD